MPLKNKITYIFTEKNIIKIDQNKHPHDKIITDKSLMIMEIMRYNKEGRLHKITTIPIHQIVETQQYFIYTKEGDKNDK